MFLGAKGGHKASPNRLKIDEKSMQKSMRNSAGFLHGLGNVFGRLWACFWDPGPFILSVSCTRDANSQKFVFFMFDFGRFWGGLGGHFGSQRATKIASNFD